MTVSASRHLGGKALVPEVERPELSFPAQGLRMSRVAELAFGQDRPNGVKLAVLAQQMLPAKHARRQIPYPHE